MNETALASHDYSTMASTPHGPLQTVGNVVRGSMRLCSMFLGEGRGRSSGGVGIATRAGLSSDMTAEKEQQ